MNNNDVLRDVAFLGCVQGATSERSPGTSLDPDHYATIAARCNAFATAMDQAIPSQNPAPTLSEATLLQSLCAGYWTARFPGNTDPGHYASVCAVLAAKYTELKASLVNAPALGIPQAVISFSVKASFPLSGPSPVFTVTNKAQTFGATYVGVTELTPGILQVEYHLNQPIPDASRVELAGLTLRTLPPPLAPFIPVAVTQTPANDSQVLQVVAADDSPPPPGSPDVTVEFQTAVYRTT